jgi:hypothetical protein
MLAVLVALPVPFFGRNSFYLIGISIWMLLFFGGFLVPPLIGIIINSVKEHQKASANSISNLLQNLIGYLPAPGLYGFVASLSSQRWALGMLMYSSIFTVLLLILGIKIKLE